MPVKTKSLVTILAFELLGACLLSGLIVFGVSRVLTASAQTGPSMIPAQTSTTRPSSSPQPPVTLMPQETHSAFTPLPTFPFISTETAAPVYTLTPDSETLSAQGPLSYPQQLLLYNVSLRYLAPTTADASRVAKDLNFIGRDGHPSNMCGPLAFAILRDAGLVDPKINLEEYWLLNPRDWSDQKLLEKTFPSDRFVHYEFTQSLKNFNWARFPLLPGDFLYIYSGKGGNFEHMLVVSRVDSQKRAFAVTNYATRDGFIIEELNLYDPAEKTAGIFYTWTANPYAKLGATGFAGFDLWRLRTP